MLANIIAEKTKTRINKHIGTLEEIEAREADAKVLHAQLVRICRYHPRFVAGRVQWGAITISKAMHSYQVRIHDELVFDFQPQVIDGYDSTIGYYSKPMSIHRFENGIWRVLVDALEQDVLKDNES